MNQDNKMDIATISYFLDFSIAVKEAIISMATIRTYNKMQTVYEKGDTCKTVDIVINGNLQAHTLSENGTENILVTFKRESIMGCNFLFSDTQKYPFSIFCHSNCTLLSLTEADILELIKNSEFALFFIKHISKNAQSLNKKVMTYSQNTLHENIIEYVEDLCKKQKKRTVKLPITKKELATLFGVQRQSLFRELKKMANDGIIAYKNKEITLL